jgi:ankyrin repeat protein
MTLYHAAQIDASLRSILSMDSSFEIGSLLIDSGASLDLQISSDEFELSGGTALHFAVENQSEEFVRLLLDGVFEALGRTATSRSSFTERLSKSLGRDLGEFYEAIIFCNNPIMVYRDFKVL